VVDVLKEIRNLLADGLPAAAQKGAQGVQDEFAKHPVTIPVEYDYRSDDPSKPYNYRTPTPAPPPEIGLQGGTHGQYVDWGSGTPVTLHGRERVTPEGEAVHAGGGAPIQITVISTLDGKEIARNQIKYIPRALALAGV
jgi:hypothetical protein